MFTRHQRLEHLSAL